MSQFLGALWLVIQVNAWWDTGHCQVTKCTWIFVLQASINQVGNVFPNRLHFNLNSLGKAFTYLAWIRIKVKKVLSTVTPTLQAMKLLRICIWPLMMSIIKKINVVWSMLVSWWEFNHVKWQWQSVVTMACSNLCTQTQ